MQVAIIGAGPAALNAAITLRKINFQDKILMFSAEKVPPYSPAALGEYLINNDEQLLYWLGRDAAQKYAVDFYQGEKIVEVDAEKKKIYSGKSRSFKFDKLLIASGSSLYIPPVLEGYDKEEITNFKTIAGAEKIKKMAQKGGKTAVIVGGGFLGVEIALILSKLGIKASILNRRSWIMPRLLDKETAEYVVRDLEKQGVNVLLNTEGKKFVGNKKVEKLITSAGRELKADIYIAATGVKPNISFLKESSVKTDGWSVKVDRYLKTNHPDIFACGDVAATEDLISGEKVVHGLYPVAVKHGRRAALNMIQSEQKYERQLSMNSLKEFSFKIIIVGKLKGEVLKFRDKNSLRKIYLKDNRINGFVLLGNIRSAGLLFSLLRKRRDISYYKEDLLKKNFNPAFLISRFK